MNQMKDRIKSVILRSKKPMNLTTISGKAEIGRKQRGQMQVALEELVAEGAVVHYNGRYGSPPVMGVVPCEIVKVTATFGFAKPLDENREDLFIPGRFLEGTMPRDRVLVQVSRSPSGGELTEGRVIKILEEANPPFSGTLIALPNGRIGIQPDSYVSFSLPLSKGSEKLGQVGDKVLVTTRRRGHRHNAYTVDILEVFGAADSAANNANAILAEQQIVRAFPLEVEQEAEKIGKMTIHPNEISQRLDLRQENIFTIDGADTKDIDDAISLTLLKDGWELGVHIADVSYYVHRDSPLDQEAFRRGNSVYFADQVVPMLPSALSNGICSLNPQEDRLAFSALIRLNSSGIIESYRFEKTMIRSRLQGVYSEINEILEDTASPEVLEKYQDQRETLYEMERLARLLSSNREGRNSINLESTESRILVNEEGIAVGIEPRETGISEKIIEEFMLTANQAAAMFATEEEIPFIYRVHEPPPEDRLEALFQLLDSLGIPYLRPTKKESPAPMLAQVLKEVQGTETEGIINYSILRTMAKAEYNPENKGHFGLGLYDYAHFTSPIRRYSDLAIHRILTSLLTGMRRDNVERHFRNWVADASQQSTRREIGAMTAERDIEDCYKAEYMKPFVGQEFQGVISSATGFGIFVQLENTVEGLIHTDNFPPGRWYYDQIITYSNEVGGATLRVGDSITVVLQGVTISAGQIDFVFAHPEEYSTASGSTTITTGKKKR